MIYNQNFFQIRKHQLERMLKIIDRQEKCTILFYGDSLIEYMGNVEHTSKVINSGIAGATTALLLSFIDEAVLSYHPKQVYILVGTNDLGDSTQLSPREIALNIKKMKEVIEENLEGCKVYCISLLPCIEELQSHQVLNYGIRSNDIIQVVNKEIQKFISKEYFISVFDEFLDPIGNVNYALYQDGLHINKSGYKILLERIKNFTK